MAKFKTLKVSEHCNIEKRNKGKSIIIIRFIYHPFRLYSPPSPSIWFITVEYNYKICKILRVSDLLKFQLNSFVKIKLMNPIKMAARDEKILDIV